MANAKKYPATLAELGAQIPSLPEKTSIDVDTDFLVIFDELDNTLKRVRVANLPGGTGGSGGPTDWGAVGDPPGTSDDYDLLTAGVTVTTDYGSIT